MPLADPPIPPAPSRLALVVALDERDLSRDDLLLRADDLGVLRGDGVFEAFLVVDGEPWLLDEHLARLERSARAVDLALPAPARWRRAVARAIASWRGGPEMVLRLIATRGPEETDAVSGYVLADAPKPTAIEQRHHGIAVVTLERGFDSELAGRAPWLLLGAKTLSYAVNMAALRWARNHAADDVVFFTSDGAVLEAPTSSVVVARGRTLLSPPTSLGILPSVTLGDLFSRAPEAGWEVGYESLSVEDLHEADGVWLLSSVRLSAQVHTIDGKAITEGRRDGSGLGEEIAGLVRPVAPSV